MNFRDPKRIALSAIWTVAAIAALFLYRDARNSGSMIGMVESVTRNVLVLESGTMASLSVEIGAVVAPGQMLAKIDAPALAQEAAALRAEIDSQVALCDAEAKRIKIENIRERDGLLENALALEHELAEGEAEIASKKAEMAEIDQQIERVSSVNSAGLGRAADLGELTLSRSGLAGWLSGATEANERLRSRIKHARESLARWEQGSEALDALPPSGGAQEHLAELRAELANVEERIRLCQIIAPCAGRVVAIAYHSGDTVAAMTPILSIQETAVHWADAYFPDANGEPPAPGSRVSMVAVQRSGAVATGVVVAVTPGYMPMQPEVIGKPVTSTARKVRIRIDGNAGVRPGERVMISCDGGKADSGIPAAAEQPASQDPDENKEATIVPLSRDLSASPAS